LSLAQDNVEAPLIFTCQEITAQNFDSRFKDNSSGIQKFRSHSHAEVGLEAIWSISRQSFGQKNEYEQPFKGPVVLKVTDQAGNNHGMKAYT